MKPWRILHVDLLKPIPSLCLERDQEGVYVYFWCHGLLLGRKILASSELPVSSRGLCDEAIRSILPAVAHYWKVNVDPALPDLSMLSVLDRPLERLPERLAPDDARRIDFGNHLHAGPTLVFAGMPDVLGAVE